jgi:hypothetical protein
MPHFTITIGSDGPIIDLSVAVGLSWQGRLAARGSVAPAPVSVRALIDTGSDPSVVHPQVLQQLGVQATGSIRIRQPGTGSAFRLAGVSDVRLSIGGLSPGTLWISMPVVSVALSTPTVLALIGRDVLERCTLFYNGPRGDVTLSF